MTGFTYVNHNDTSIELPLYNFKSGDFTGDTVTFRKTLFATMHPGVSSVVGEVPTATELDNKENKIKEYVKLMQDGIERTDTTHYFDFSGGARTHGRAIFTNGAKIGELYFGKGNSMGVVNYGSILLTECRKIISAELNVLIVDDEDPELRKTGLGDSHAKCHSDVLVALSAGVARQAEEGEDNTPLQIRVGFLEKFLFKGTVTTFEDDKLPQVIIDRYGDDWDIILTLSGIKGNKPKADTELRKELAYLGNVHFSEEREAVASQQFWMWYTPKAIENDVIPGLTDVCQKLKSAIEDRTRIGEVFRNVDDVRADIGYSGQIDPESWEASDDGFSSSSAGKETQSSKWKDPLDELLTADKEGTLLTHPYVANKIADKLARRWRRLALNTHITFKSFMAMPDDSIPNGQFVCGNLPLGYHIVFRNPILHYGSIRLMKNVKGSVHHESQTAMYLSHKSASDSQGDFDGDYFSVIPLDNPQQIFAAKVLSSAIDPTFAQQDFEDYISGKLTFPQDKFKHIIFETAFQEYLWGDTPVINKPSKVKVTGDPEEVFYRSMDNIVGYVSNKIQHSKSNGTFNKEITIPIHDEKTDQYTGGNKKTTVIAFLSQEMQIAVDRLKNNVYHNMKGIDAAVKVIDAGKKPAWLDNSNYKSKDAYKHSIIPIGTVEKAEGGWVSVSDQSFPEDVVSMTIAIVNSYWVKWKTSTKHISEFREFFPNAIFDRDVAERARKLHLWYGSSMSNAAKIGSDADQKEQFLYIDARKKAMRVVRDEAEARRALRDKIEDTLLAANLGQPQMKALYEGDRTAEFNFLPNIEIKDGERGIWKNKEGVYSILTSADYAAALWRASHTTGASQFAIGGSVFKMYIDEIIKQLNKEPTLTTSAWFGGHHQELGDFIFGDADATPSDLEVRDGFPLLADKKDTSHTVYMPSRIKGRELLPVDSTEGTIIPNQVQIMVETDGVLKDRTGGTKYVIYMRSNPTRDWRKLGVVSSGKPVPEVGKIYTAKLYTTKLSKEAQPLLEMKGSERYRTSGGIFEWVEN